MGSSVMAGNLIDSSTVIITSSSVDAVHGVAKLFDQILGDRMKFAETPSGGTITILADNSDPPTTGIASAAAIDPGLDTTGQHFHVPTTARYVRIIQGALFLQFDFGEPKTFNRLAILNGNLAQTAETAEIGQVVIAAETQLPRAHRFGKTLGRRNSEIFQETQFEVAWVLQRARRVVWEGEWQVPESDLAIFDQLDFDVLGRALPFVFIPETTLPAVLYARKSETAKDFLPAEMSTPIDPPWYELSFSVVEESRGVAILA